MAMFYYVGGNRERAIFKGEVEAENSYTAALKLRRQGLFILDLRKTTQIGPFDLEIVLDKITGFFSPELKSMERVLFTTHLASMLKTGVSIIESISAFDDEGSATRTKRMFKSIVSDLESGKPLSLALSRYPRTFSPVYTHIISAGESMGTLSDTLEYLGAQLQRDHEMIGRIKGAMMYPIVVMTVMVAVLIFITVSVVPKLLTFSLNAGRELPASTKILITLSDIIVRYGVFIFIFLIGLIITILRFIKTKRGKAFFDTLLLRIPLIGSLVTRFNIARFARLLGSFYHYGIPLPTAFSILATSLPNTNFELAVNRMKERMAHGMSLSASIEGEKTKLFPKILVRVLRSAEKSAEVDAALGRLAEYYENELEGTIKNITTIIEPILILVLGVAVMGIALAVVVPIYQITTSFK